MPSKYPAPAASNRNAPAAGSSPVKTLRLGRIKAAVWENRADQRTFYNVTFARTYTGDDQQPHDTDSFGRDDLPLVAKIADRAHTFIFERLAGQKPEAQAE